MHSNLSPRRKLIVVGDGACGKTCLLHVYTHKGFPEVKVVTSHDIMRAQQLIFSFFMIIEICTYCISELGRGRSSPRQNIST